MKRRKGGFETLDTKYLKRVFLGVLIALLCLGFAAYLIYHISLYFRNTIVTTTASVVTERRFFETDAYLFRKEKVLEGGKSGTLCPAVADGVKVGIGSKVADVFLSAKDTDLLAAMTDLQNQLAILKESTTGKTTDVSLLQSRIAETVASIRAQLDSGDAASALSSRDQLLVQMNRLQLATSAGTDFSAEIAELESRIADLRNQLGVASNSVYAPTSGYYFRNTDGGESIFSPDALDEINARSLRELGERYADRPAASPNAGKLALDFRWYLAFPLARSDSEPYSVGQTMTVIFPENENFTLQMEIYKVVRETGNQDAVIVLVTTQLPDGFRYQRCQNVRVVAGEYTGYSVPNSALRLVDDEIGVYVLTGADVSFKKLKILYETGDTVIAAPEEEIPAGERSAYLRLHDSIIIQGKDLYDGKIVIW